MENFKEIAEKCLSGELSGTFVLRDGSEVKSNHLRRLPPSTDLICSYGLRELYISDKGNAYGHNGYSYRSSIKTFIPDMKKEQITIDIPEGMEVIREEAPGEIKIKFVKKELTYEDIVKSMDPKLCILPFTTPDSNTVNDAFFDKVNTLRKLTNIRNYFGKPNSYDRGYCVSYNSYDNRFYVGNINSIGIWTKDIVFKEKEHAEQAIKMLGDELKYLFEPW